MKKIGLLGGSFDPIHFGHLNLAINLAEKCQLDQVLFCPTALSPFKRDKPPLASDAHRLKMIEMAIAPIASFALLDWEVSQGGLSFTIDTVRKLTQQANEVHLLIGEDHLSTLHHWKDADELVKLAPPLIAARASETPLMLPQFSPDLLAMIRAGRVEIPIMEMSSTHIRARLQNKQFCGHLVPAPVLDYIAGNHLYEKK